MSVNPYEHRHKFGIDIPGSIGGLKIDDRVVYQKDGIQCIGYIYCFRQFGYTWFAWVYSDTGTMQAIDFVPVSQLDKPENNGLKYATNKFEN